MQNKELPFSWWRRVASIGLWREGRQASQLVLLAETSALVRCERCRLSSMEEKRKEKSLVFAHWLSEILSVLIREWRGSCLRVTYILNIRWECVRSASALLSPPCLTPSLLPHVFCSVLFLSPRWSLKTLAINVCTSSQLDAGLLWMKMMAKSRGTFLLEAPKPQVKSCWIHGGKCKDTEV